MPPTSCTSRATYPGRPRSLPHIATNRARKGSKRLRLATGRLPENLAPLLPWACLGRRSSVDHEHTHGDRHPHHQQPYRQVGYPLGPVDRPARAEPPEGRQGTPRDGHQWVPVYHGRYGRTQPQDGCYPDERVEALGLGRRSGSAYHLLLTPSSCRLARRAQYPTSWGVGLPGPWATLGKPSPSPCVEGEFSEVGARGPRRCRMDNGACTHAPTYSRRRTGGPPTTGRTANGR